MFRDWFFNIFTWKGVVRQRTFWFKFSETSPLNVFCLPKLCSDNLTDDDSPRRISVLKTAVHTLDVDKDFDEDSWRLKGVLRGLRVVKDLCACSNRIKILFHFVLFFGRVLFGVFSSPFQMHININAGWHFESIQDYENIIFTDQGGTPLVKLWTTGPIQTNPKSWKSGKP